MQDFAASVFILLLAGLRLSSQTEYIGSGLDICRLFPDGTKLRKPGYCDRWIQCENSISVDAGICIGEMKYFSLSKGQCHSSLDSWDTYCKDPCTSKTSGYVGDTFNCANWYFCDKTRLVGKGVCEHGMWFDQAKQICAYPKDVPCSAKFELCDVAPSGANIKDELNCNKYITCKSGKNSTSICENGLYYDASSSSCIRKSLVSCPNHPYPENVCGTKKLAIRNKFVADGASCRGYFFCRDLGSGVPDLQPQWLQCPLGTFFNAALELCMDKTIGKCKEDRCDGRESGFELAEDLGCQTYFECKNGAVVQEFKCAADTYFDVKTETCTPEPKNYSVCSNTIDKYDPNNWNY